MSVWFGNPIARNVNWPLMLVPSKNSFAASIDLSWLMNWGRLFSRFKRTIADLRSLPGSPNYERRRSDYGK